MDNRLQNNSLKVLIKHPGTAKILKDALSAPIGSTKREYATKVYKILDRLSAQNDGQGGPGFQKVDQPYATQENLQKGKVFVFKRIPTPVFNRSKNAPKEVAFDGQGGPGWDWLKDSVKNVFGGWEEKSIAANAPKPSPSYLSTTSAGASGNVGGLDLSTYKVTDAPQIKPFPKQGVTQTTTAQKPVVNNVPTSLGTQDTTQPTRSISGIQSGPTQTYGPTPTISTTQQTYSSSNFADWYKPISTPVSVDQIMNAIAIIESRGSGDYAAEGPVLTSGMYTGDRAYGKYQIMGKNIPEWSKAALGYSITPQEFMKSPELQDKIARHKLSEYYNTYKNPDDVASKWFTGRPFSVSGTDPKDQLGTTNLQYINDFRTALGVETLDGVPSKLSSEQAARAAVSSSSGPGMFAMNQMSDPRDPITQGLSLSERLLQNRETLEDKYKIDELQEKAMYYQKVAEVLPESMVSYIRGRDENLNETQGLIDDVKNKIATNQIDMSNPEEASKTRDYLNYLYLLRGQTNSRYIDYVNNAINTFTNNQKVAVDNYNNTLATFQNDLESTNLITQEQYTEYTNSLREMYETLENAPVRDAQLKLLQEQVRAAQITNATDPITSFNEAQYMELHNKYFKGQIIDNDGFLNPGTTLEEVISRYQNNADIPEAYAIAAYVRGVERILNANKGEKTQNNFEITNQYKQEVGEEAIQQLMSFAATAQQTGNTYAFNLGEDEARGIANYLVSSKNSAWDDSTISALREEIMNLSKKTIFRNPKVKNEAEFIKNIQEKTGGAVDESIIKAIWAAYQAYVMDTLNGRPEDFVNTFLYNVGSTEDRANPQLLDNDSLRTKINQEAVDFFLHQF